MNVFIQEFNDQTTLPVEYGVDERVEGGVRVAEPGEALEHRGGHALLGKAVVQCCVVEPSVASRSTV